MDLRQLVTKKADGSDRPIIPFNRPYLTGQESELLQQLTQTRHFSGDGPFTKRCNQLLESLTGGLKALLTTSCTHALEMSALLLDIQPGDEVIVPSFTFVSVPNAFALRDVKIVFCDIRRDTLNIDDARLSELITSRTKAIVVVHYAGVACEMDTIRRIASENGVAIVEDNAHGLMGKYKGKPLGSFGAMATQSFHETKNLQCGEGGALILNDPNLIERAEIIREKGTNRSKFFRGQVDKYTWVDIGSSYLPSDILAGILFLQLERASQIQDMRRRIWHRYDEALANWAKEQGIERPYVPSHCDQAFHMYYLVLPDLASRSSLIEHLKNRRVMSVFHYQPLNISQMGQRFGGLPGACPVTESVADRLLRFPFFNDMSDEEWERIEEAILSWRRPQ